MFIAPPIYYGNGNSKKLPQMHQSLLIMRRTVMMKTFTIFAAIIIFVLLAQMGCKKDEAPTAPQNHAPVIQSVNSSPTSSASNRIPFGTTVRVSVVATDQDGDKLSCSWHTEKGSFVSGSNADTAVWQPSPSTNDENYVISITVSDGVDTAASSITIYVSKSTPQVVILSAPVDNAIDQSISPVLSWNASTRAASYALQVSTSNTFGSFVYNDSGLTSTSKQVTGLANLTKYYWRVNAKNSYGSSGWSTVWSFTTTGIPPQVPALSTPVDNATDQAISPVLSWNASSGAVSYALQVSTSNTFGSFMYNDSGLTITSQQVTGLGNGTTYYWRVKAKNTYGSSSWSTPWRFTTQSACAGTSTVTYAGKTYNTVAIGNQCWLKENLDVGTRIDVNQNQSNNGIIEKYCYNNDPANCNTYGGLYQWNEAMQYITTAGTQGICPPLWHIPTKAELETLKDFEGGDGNALKAVGQGTGNGVGTNTSGFSALLAGYRDAGGYSYDLGRTIHIWSSTAYDATNGHLLNLYNDDGGIYMDYHQRIFGFSVRCVKD